MRLRVRPTVGAAGLLAIGGVLGFGWYLGMQHGWGLCGAAGRSRPLPSIDAELRVLSAPGLARRGPDRIVALRLGRRSRLVPHHLRDAQPPQSIEAWSAQLGAAVVFNGGQFDPFQLHLGLLKGRGVPLASRLKPAYLGLLVSGPLSARAAARGPQSRILDLGQPPFRDLPRQSLVDGYHNVVQSMMLLDEHGQVRVRRSQLAACRTVVAESQNGLLMVVMTEGAVTLEDLAQWLQRGPLKVRRAMNLDGGLESQLAVRSPELSLTLYGQYGSSRTLLPGQAMVHAPLPTVIALEL